MEHWDVPHVEFAHVLNALGQVVGGHDTHWRFNQIRSDVDHCALVELTDLEMLACDGQVNTPKIACELGPVQELFVGCWWIHLNVEVGREVLSGFGRALNIISQFVFKSGKSALRRPTFILVALFYCLCLHHR